MYEEDEEDKDIIYSFTEEEYQKSLDYLDDDYFMIEE